MWAGDSRARIISFTGYGGTLARIDAVYWAQGSRLRGDFYFLEDLVEPYEVEASAIEKVSVSTDDPGAANVVFTGLSERSAKTHYIVYKPTGSYPAVRIQSLTITEQFDDTPPVDTAINPDGDDIRYDANIDFTWEASIPEYTSLESSQLQKSTDGVSWTGSGFVQNGETTWRKPARDFGLGDFLWRVKSKTNWSDWGEYSAPKTFRVLPALSVATPVSPKGYVFCPPNKSIELTWKVTSAHSGYTPEKCDLQYWYLSGGAIWQDIATVTHGERSYTVPPDFFPADQIHWRVRAYNMADEPGPWSTAAGFFTVDADAISSIISPKGGVYQNQNRPIALVWNVSNKYGNPPTKSEIQWGTQNDESSYSPLATVIGSGTNYTAPAGTFPGSRIYWRVRAYNQSDVPGPWTFAEFTTVDAEAIASIVNPKDGASMNEKLPIVLNWIVDNAFGNAPTKSQIQWNTQDDAETYVDLTTVIGSGTSYTVPADTFPGSEIYWRVRAYNQSGIPGSWAYADFSTLDTPSVATPVSPIGTIESADAPIVFLWTAYSDSGSSPSGADVQYLNSSDEWELLGTTDGATILVVPEDTIPAGVVYWRVRSYNRNGTAGPWSEPVSFAAYAAPKIRAVFADSMPYATIRWQVDGQLAFEVRVDGEVYGPYFGDGVRSFTLPVPLTDGEHLAAVRAQNAYGLWSRWYEIPFMTASQVSDMLALTVETDLDVLLTWTGGGVEPPVIDVQPENMSTTGGLICFSVSASGTGLRYSWEMLLPGSAAWQAAPGGSQQIWTHAATEDYDGTRFRCRVSNAAGVAVSSAALYRYQDPAEEPAITIQPTDTKKRVGTVRLVCGATGSAYRWYRREAHSGDEDPDAIGVSDGTGGVWRIPSGPGGALTIGVSDDTGGVWHMPSGAGETGAINVTDAAQRFWNFPSGRGIPDFVDTGVTTPTLSFQASADRDGSLFYCLVSNSAGAVTSNICTYSFADPDTPEQTGNYSVFRDGVLLAKAEYPQYTDRTAIGVHSYQVTEQLPNNDVVRSNIVTVDVETDCLVIAPLDGGAWLKLKLSDREPRELSFARSRQVAYVHYAGRRYPETEVGEQEDFIGTFDASWPYGQEEEADALEALIGENVVVKTRQGVVIVGVLQGYDRRDPRFYKSYSFQIRQDDLGGTVDA